MAFKSDTLPTGRMAFAKRGKEPPYVNLEPKSSGKTPQAKSKCSPPPAKSKTNREYERLATALVEKGREGSPRGALPPIDGVRFRDCTKAKQRVGLAALDYEAQKQGELTLKHGSMMEIVAEEYGQEGWALARVDTLGRGDGTRVGIVPKHYLALMGSQPEIVDRESVQRSADFLGSGAYAEVFRGTHKGKQVALKLARSECDEALKREALILSRLCHENIVQFFGMSLDPVFIVLELCEGGTLNSIYRQMESSDVLTVFFWAKQVASALEHLHGRNEPLVYADLKAANVLVKQKPCACGLEDGTWKAKDDAGRADGQCQNEKCRGRRIDRLTLKLADFNVSRYAGEKRDSCSGSMPWKAPDLMKNGAISHPKMDVWSFGMFIYELLTRKLPDFDVIIYWMSFIQRGNPLPLPDDLPEAIREIFVGCWQWENEKRPTIAEVKMELEKAEKSVESNYKWKLDTEKQQKKGAQSEGAAAEAVAALEQLQQQKPLMFNISEQMVQLYLERVYKKSCKKPTKMERMWAAWFQPPDPKRQKRPMKLDKQSIGTPIGFRHVVSGKVCERADNPCDKPKVKLYANAELAPLQRQQSHRSHESLLECVGGSSDKNGKNAVGYSTLPRTFRVHQSQQQNMSSDAHLLLPPPVPPKSSCCRVHPCCAKKLGGLVKIKAAKSNPELNNLGTKSGGGGGAKVFPMAMGGMGNGDGRYHQIRHQSPQPISRPHDYLSLLPNSAIFRQQHQHNQHQQMDKCQRLTRPLPTVVVPPDSSVGPEEDCPLRKDRAEPDWAEADGAPSAFCNDNNELEIGRRQYVNLPHSVQKAARRTNAVRQRMVAEVTGISPESSDCSSSVTTPNGAGGCASEMPSVTTRDGNAREDGTSGTGGIDSLPELLNRRVSPPHHRHHHHSLSPSTALSGGSGASIQLRRATCGELDKSRRGELGHSTFYVDEPDSPSTEGANASHSLAATPSSDEMGSGGRRRSAAGSGGVHRSIASLLFKPLIGAKTSPRGSDQQVEPDTAVGMASGGITVACCFHPHHGAVVPHLCALSSMFVPECQLGPASDQLSTRPIDIVSESAGHVTVQRNAQHNPKFIKRADYPENQARQRHRTESAATAAAQQSHRRTYHNSSNGGGKCFTPAITEPSRQRRVSSSVMDTVIEMPQCVSRSSAIGGASSAFLRAQSPRGSSSSSILNTTIPLHAHNISSSTLLLSPDHAALPHWHQRSHSSDSPAGKPLSSNDLAELLRRHPVPIDGSIANPSYVPMKENAKNVKLVVPTTKSVHSSPQAPSFSAQKQEERPKRPVPMPRREGTKKIEGRKEDNSAQCPTSQAPVLNRAEMVTSENLSMALNDFSMPVSEQRRPTTLRLGPPPLPPCAVPPPTTVSVSLSGCASDSFGHNSANAVANSSQNGGGWDSGMCASSSNEGDDCSPQTFAPPKGVVACCSATVFPAGAHQSTVVPEPPSECAHRHFRLPSSVNVSHHFFSSPPFPPPPVPPKLHKDKEGPRVPPLPRNRRMMKQ